MWWLPSIIQESLQLFICIEIDGVYYLKKDTNLKCWEKDHYDIALSIGLSQLLIWALIFPLLVIYKINKIKSNLSDEENLKIYGMFYIGFNDDQFYWGVIIETIRKASLIICVAVLGNQP